MSDLFDAVDAHLRPRCPLLLNDRAAPPRDGASSRRQTAPPSAGNLTFGEDALIPIALLSDCAVYLSDGPSPLDVLPRTADGKPAPGTFRLGVSPGMVKHEGTQDLLWAVAMLDEGHNPARHIKGDIEDSGE
ncbi:hypothetical protein [Streptomyces sp. NPDC058394]|uniref:hypothetical protein n=1 Tax=Streptomyces sp. NPDC058394 TaxID=3346477 RepID=UPI0036480F9F